MSERNLKRMFARADSHDLAEGRMAYERYHNLMRAIAERYATPLPRVIAAFCTLSPNNDYMGNLRSLISVLDGVRDGAGLADIQVSTYRHCMVRAHAYLTGARDFEHMTRGLKVLNFYHNVLDPSDQRWVTIDGHMVAAWRGQNLTMKEALLRRRSEYHQIAGAVKRLAFAQFMLPQQYQAVIWFVRKRTLGIKYEAQTDIFYQGDLWRTAKPLDDIKPFPRRWVGVVPGNRYTGGVLGVGPQANERANRNALDLGQGHLKLVRKRLSPGRD